MNVEYSVAWDDGVVETVSIHEVLYLLASEHDDPQAALTEIEDGIGYNIDSMGCTVWIIRRD